VTTYKSARRRIAVDLFYLRWVEFALLVYECDFSFLSTADRSCQRLASARYSVSKQKNICGVKKKVLFVELQEVCLLNNNLWTLR
jgi:hypothetical protein